MAPNGHPMATKKSTRPSEDGLPPSWAEQYGHSEWQAWRDADPSHQMTYDVWKQSGQHTNGLSLYYAAMRILHEPDSDDEEAPPVKAAKPQPAKVTSKPVGRPKKKPTMNGDGPSRSTEPATPSAVANSEDLSPSAKKKRKARKKPVSEEFIASDIDSGEVVKEAENSTPRAEVATPSAPIITVNGKRKSSARKTKKKLSEETISPEDELEDPMDTTVDVIVTPAVASPLPVRPAPKSPALGQTSESPKKSHILKLSTRKTSKKKAVSEDAVPENDANDKSAPAYVTPKTVTSVTELNITVNTDEKNSTAGSLNQDVDSTAASPDPTSAATSSTRRGLRTRKPAQQRPYYHDAQLFEDAEPPNGDAQDPISPAPMTQSRRGSVASISKNVDDALLAQLDEEAIALLQEEPESESKGPKHFKGKGRAWKKEGSDEDEEFSLAARKKAAKAARMKAKGIVPKKRGRPRKSGRSEETIQDDSDSDTIRRKRPPPRKSALSEEIVPDSDADERVKEEESTTPKESPDKSYTPKGMPKIQQEVDATVIDDSELGSDDGPEVVSPSK